MLILLCRSTLVLKEIAAFLNSNTQDIKKNVLYIFGKQQGIEILALSTYDDKLLKSIIDNFLKLIDKQQLANCLDINPYLKTWDLVFWWLNFKGFKNKKLEQLKKIILTEVKDLKDNLKENIP